MLGRRMYGTIADKGMERCTIDDWNKLYLVKCWNTPMENLHSLVINTLNNTKEGKN